MKSCQQTPKQNVYEHGLSVWRHFQQIVEHLRTGSEIPDWWRLPQWLYADGILEKLMPIDIINEYIVMHDCGKPFVLEISKDGRRHYPDHAIASERIWKAVGGNEQSARLMGMDMDAHLLKGDQIAEFSCRPEGVTLLVTALAEVHSNAELFGGGNSDSFKMKAKHLDKRGRQVITHMKEQGKW